MPGGWYVTPRRFTFSHLLVPLDEETELRSVGCYRRVASQREDERGYGAKQRGRQERPLGRTERAHEERETERLYRRDFHDGSANVSRFSLFFRGGSPLTSGRFGLTFCTRVLKNLQQRDKRGGISVWCRAISGIRERLSRPAR